MMAVAESGGQSSMKQEAGPNQTLDRMTRSAVTSRCSAPLGSLTVRVMDSLAPAHSALPGLRLAPNSFRLFPKGSSGLPKPATIGLPQVVICVITHRERRHPPASSR